MGSSDGSIHGLIPLSPLHLTPHTARAVLLAVVVILAFPLTMKEKLGEWGRDTCVIMRSL